MKASYIFLRKTIIKVIYFPYLLFFKTISQSFYNFLNFHDFNMSVKLRGYLSEDRSCGWISLATVDSSTSVIIFLVCFIKIRNFWKNNLDDFIFYCKYYWQLTLGFAYLRHLRLYLRRKPSLDVSIFDFRTFRSPEKLRESFPFFKKLLKIQNPIIKLCFVFECGYLYLI